MTSTHPHLNFTLSKFTLTPYLCPTFRQKKLILFFQLWQTVQIGKSFQSDTSEVTFGHFRLSQEDEPWFADQSDITVPGQSKTESTLNRRVPAKNKMVVSFRNIVQLTVCDVTCSWGHQFLWLVVTSSFKPIYPHLSSNCIFVFVKVKLRVIPLK